MSANPADHNAPGAAGANDEAVDDASADVDALAAAGDVDGLLALARASRAAKDMATCLAAYSAAAALGSAEADYAAALFYMTGRVAPQDVKAGATRLRSAADKGYLQAKVYVANLYELGIHYKADSAKASTWYRNVARQAGLDDDPASTAYARAMADLGCARHARVLLEGEGGALPDADRAAILKKARAFGYELAIGEGVAGEATASRTSGLPPVPSLVVDADVDADPQSPAPTITPSTAPPEAPAERARVITLRIPGRTGKGLRVAGAALAACGWATVMVVAAIGAGHLAVVAAREVVARQGALPVLGVHAELALIAALVLVALPATLLVYTAGAVARAAVVATLAGVVAFLRWIPPLARLVPEPAFAAAYAGALGLLVALLVLGFLGGAKTKR